MTGGDLGPGADSFEGATRIPRPVRGPGARRVARPAAVGVRSGRPAAIPGGCRHDWAALWASLGRSPWILPAAQSPTGKTARLDQDNLADALYQALHASDIAPIPVIVHTLGTATNKTAALASLTRILAAAGLTGTGDGTTPMMQYEILCAEPWATAIQRRCRISKAASTTRTTCTPRSGGSTSAR